MEAGRKESIVISFGKQMPARLAHVIFSETFSRSGSGCGWPTIYLARVVDFYSLLSRSVVCALFRGLLDGLI